MNNSKDAHLVQVRQLNVAVKNSDAQILRGVDLVLSAGDSLGIVGESGSGKSTLAYAICNEFAAGLYRHGGEVAYRGTGLNTLHPAQVEALRGAELALMPQHASSALSPTRRVGDLVAEPALVHGKITPADVRDHVVQLLTDVGLPTPALLAGRFPHELSGGQRQRVALAVALSAQPSVLILDEPTSGLDATTQAAILPMLRELRATRHLTLICITHDMAVASALCDQIAVMYSGEVVEVGATSKVLQHPQHPYTAALLASVIDFDAPALPTGIAGAPPRPTDSILGCRFAARCAFATDSCREVHPLLSPLEGAAVRCIRPGVATARPEQPTIRERREPGDVLLTAENLTLDYGQGRGKRSSVRAVHPMNFTLRAGEVLAIVGESGSGKSTLSRAIAGLHEPTDGQLLLDGRPLASAASRRTSSERRALQLVFQHADQALNPRRTVAQELERVLVTLGDTTRRASRDKATELLHEVGLGKQHLHKYPSELSGGEQQRVALARAVAANPRILICDEIVSALDVSVQARVLELLERLRQQRDLALLFISHDLGVVRAFADRVLVMESGHLRESGSIADVLTHPQHPYTRDLLESARSIRTFRNTESPA